MKWFGKTEKPESESSSDKSSDSLEDFDKYLDESLREEKTQVIMAKKQESKAKAMVRTLLDAGYSIEEINIFLSSNKKYVVKEGNAIEEKE